MPAKLTPFGQVVRELRTEVRQTTADMAGDLNMSSASLLNYELGLHNLTFDLVENCLRSLRQWQPTVVDEGEIPVSLGFGSEERLRIAAAETPFRTPMGRLLQAVRSFGYNAEAIMQKAGVDENFSGTNDQAVVDGIIAAVQAECEDLFDEWLRQLFSYYFADGHDEAGEMVHTAGVSFGTGFKRTPLAELMDRIRARYRITIGGLQEQPGAKDYNTWRNGAAVPDQAGITAFITAIKAHGGAAGHDEIAMLHHYAGIPYDPR